MRISEITGAPKWLTAAKVEDEDVTITKGGTVIWHSGNWLRGHWLDGEWHDGNWLDGEWHSGEWHRGVWLAGIWRDGIWYGGERLGGTWNRGVWHGGIWRGEGWHGGEWREGVWYGGEWHRGIWRGGYVGPDSRRVLRIASHAHLCEELVLAALLVDGSRWVQIGDLWMSLEEWAQVGIEKSDLAKYPNDGSFRSQQRIAAFEWARSMARALTPCAEGSKEE